MLYSVFFGGGRVGLDSVSDIKPRTTVRDATGLVSTLSDSEHAARGALCVSSCHGVIALSINFYVYFIKNKNK